MRLQTLRGSYRKDQIKWGSAVHPWAAAGCHLPQLRCSLRLARCDQHKLNEAHAEALGHQRHDLHSRGRRGGQQVLH